VLCQQIRAELRGEVNNMTALSLHSRSGHSRSGHSRSGSQSPAGGPFSPGGPRPRGLAAPLALPASFGALLVVGAVAAASHGGLSAGWVLLLAALIAGAGSAVGEPVTALILTVVGWLTVIGFSQAPYADLRVVSPLALPAILIIAACAAAGLSGGMLARRLASRFTLYVARVPVVATADEPLSVPSPLSAVAAAELPDPVVAQRAGHDKAGAHLG
jgi:hypothetical protein